MRSMLVLGILALGGCDALWSWRLTDCSQSRSGCPAGDMAGADLSVSESTDLAGADLYGTTPKPDLVTLPPGYVSLSNRYYYNFVTNNIRLGSSDNKRALYAYPNASVTNSYNVTNNIATPIYGVANVMLAGMFAGQLDRGFLAMTADGRLLARPDTAMAAPFAQVGAAGQPLNALWMSTPDSNIGSGSSCG